MLRSLLRSLAHGLARFARSQPQGATQRRWGLIAEFARESARRRQRTGEGRWSDRAGANARQP